MLPCLDPTATTGEWGLPDEDARGNRRRVREHRQAAVLSGHVTSKVNEDEDAVRQPGVAPGGEDLPTPHERAHCLVFTSLPQHQAVLMSLIVLKAVDVRLLLLADLYRGVVDADGLRRRADHQVSGNEIRTDNAQQE